MARRNQEYDSSPYPCWYMAGLLDNAGGGIDNHNPFGPGTQPGPGRRGHSGTHSFYPPVQDPWGGSSATAWMNPETWGPSGWGPFRHQHNHHGHPGRRGGGHRERDHGNHGREQPADGQREATPNVGPDTEEHKNETTNDTTAKEDASPETLTPSETPDPEVVFPEEEKGETSGAGARRGRGRGGFAGHGRGGRGGGGGPDRGGFPRSRGHQHHHHSHHFFGPGPHRGHSHAAWGHAQGNGGPSFDFGNLLRGVTDHPFFQSILDPTVNNTQPFNEQVRDGADWQGGVDTNSFRPPIDTFNTDTAYVLHVALPGAKKEDIAVNWDSERQTLHISGVVHRTGDEAFLNTLVAGERTIGIFERDIKLPPQQLEKEAEVDGEGIGAKMENGILVVTVPKVEKEWTQVRKIDIE